MSAVPRQRDDVLRVLGVDPGLPETGLATVDDSVPVDLREIRTSGDRRARTWAEKDADKQRRVRRIADGFRAALEELRPDVVAIEQPYHQRWARGKEANRKGQDVEMLWHLVTLLSTIAAAYGCRVVLVPPAGGFQALTGSSDGDKRQHVFWAQVHIKRSPVRELAEIRLLAGDHHKADALGVAMQGDNVVRKDGLIAAAEV